MELHCPHCGYNLTGLPENRCPECGRPFDPEALRTREVAKTLPIGIDEVLSHLLWRPGLFLLTVAATVFILKAFLLVIFSGAFLLVGGLINSVYLARRLAVTVKLRRPDMTEQQRLWFICVCSAGLYLCQLAVAFGGCAGVFALFTFFN